MMTRLRTNENQLVKIAVQGKVANAYQWAEFEVAHDGKPFSLPSTGGIVYNVRTGDPAFGWEGDHIEPGVSAILDEEKRGSRANMGFNFLACVGNVARLVSGDAKGKTGVVTGHHGGVEHVTIDFDEATLQKINVDDKILIEGFGQGLRLIDFPEIKIYNLDPKALHALPVRVAAGLRPYSPSLRLGRAGGGSIGPEGKALEVGVTTLVPAELMGSGLGHNNIGTGDYDIMTHDPQAVEKYRLDKICLGDLVAVMDHDNSYGRTYRKGAVTIGIVVHSNSSLSGHGPGISTLLTSVEPRLKPVLNPQANLAQAFQIGRYRSKKKK